MPSRKPRDDSHSAGPDRRRYGLPRSWRSVANVRHYLAKQMERHARGEIDMQQMHASTAAARQLTEIILVEGTQRNSPGGLEVLPDVSQEEEAGPHYSDEPIEAEYEEVDVKERPDGSASIVVLNTPRKDEG